MAPLTGLLENKTPLYPALIIPERRNPAGATHGLSGLCALQDCGMGSDGAAEGWLRSHSEEAIGAPFLGHFGPFFPLLGFYLS